MEGAGRKWDEVQWTLYGERVYSCLELFLDQAGRERKRGGVFSTTISVKNEDDFVPAGLPENEDGESPFSFFFPCFLSPLFSRCSVAAAEPLIGAVTEPLLGARAREPPNFVGFCSLIRPLRKKKLTRLTAFHYLSPPCFFANY